MKNASIFIGQLEYFTIIWNILWPFGNIVVNWYIFPRFGILCQDKSGNPGLCPGGVVYVLVRLRLPPRRLEL
jgi:hypothetical protein